MGDNAKERKKWEPQEQKGDRNIIGKKKGDKLEKCEKGNHTGRVQGARLSTIYQCVCTFVHITLL